MSSVLLIGSATTATSRSSMRWAVSSAPAPRTCVTFERSCSRKVRNGRGDFGGLGIFQAHDFSFAFVGFGGVEIFDDLRNKRDVVVGATDEQAVCAQIDGDGQRVCSAVPMVAEATASSAAFVCGRNEGVFDGALRVRPVPRSRASCEKAA